MRRMFSLAATAVLLAVFVLPSTGCIERIQGKSAATIATAAGGPSQTNLNRGRDHARNFWTGRIAILGTTANCAFNPSYFFTHDPAGIDGNAGNGEWVASAGGCLQPDGTSFWGGTSFNPPGEIEYNTAERWSYSSVCVAQTHEIGHLLGLDHGDILANGTRPRIMDAAPFEGDGNCPYAVGSVAKRVPVHGQNPSGREFLSLEDVLSRDLKTPRQLAQATDRDLSLVKVALAALVARGQVEKVGNRYRLSRG